MVNSKKMRKSTVAIVLLSILLCLSMILTATGAWFTSNDKGDGNKIDGAFGTIEVKYTQGANATWEELPVSKSAFVVPGSKVSLDGGAITNNSTVVSYMKVKISALTVKIGEHVLTNEQIAALFGSVPAFAVTAEGATAEGENGMYKVPVGKALSIEKVNLTIANTVKNGTFGLAEGVLTVENGATITIEYSVKVAAIQADYIDATTAETQLDEMLNA